MLKYLSVPAFIASLAIGLFFIYIWGADTKEVFVYPSPETVNNVLFQDHANQCFQLKPTEVDCPSNESEIFKIPVQ